jgi:hypothetical protein
VKYVTVDEYLNRFIWTPNSYWHQYSYALNNYRKSCILLECQMNYVIRMCETSIFWVVRKNADHTGNALPWS